MTPTKIGGATIAARDPSAAWLAPELVLMLAPNTSRDVTLPAGVVTPLLLPNPRRIGCVFVLSVTVTDGTFVGPFSDPQTFGFPIPAATRILSFAVDDLYSLTHAAWFGYHASGAVIRVVEFVRPA